MDDNFLDLIITSPPYNVDLGNNKHNDMSYDMYNDHKKFCEYDSWLENILEKCFLKLKNGGRFVINIGDSKNGQIPTSKYIFNRMLDLGFIPMTTIIWNKNNCSSRTSWGSWMSPSSPSFPTPFEYIFIFAKESIKLQCKGETDLTKEEFINWSLAMWTMKSELKKNVNHPAPFPIELPYRCIKMLSWKDAIVYDPFMGSGTTAVAAKMLGRKYIGSEISKNYCEIAENRLKLLEI
jgi:site-specific DNA-methyltransferase (adenine-specific)